ncbi:MAG TPA: anhydro-N-acetylmuramic acid kinase, partial [Abditibacteriaceae bacterium]
TSLTMPLCIGLMSGTSLDGIDAVLVRIEGSGPTLRAELQAFLCVPLAVPVREQILRIHESASVAEIARLNVELGELFADAVLQLLQHANADANDIAVIGSHGQTICHLPHEHATLQIGEAAIIAERTGITTVSDFRPRDLAAGGQGAPLVPYVDWCLLRHTAHHRIVQNIGGIANCTALGAGGSLEDVRAWDSGPGNMMIDECVSVFTNGAQRFDRDGAIAATGKPDETLLGELMSHPFLARTPPKSAGREEFGCTFTAQFINTAKARALTDADMVATATAFTARSIAESYKRFAPAVLHDAAPLEIILGGGGARNVTLVRMLRNELRDGLAFASERTPVTIRTHEEFGLDGDSKEALAFAVLAHETLQGVANNATGATGARRAVVLGKISPR